MGGVLRTLRRVNAHTCQRRREVLDTRQPQREFLGPDGSIAYFKNAQVGAGAVAGELLRSHASSRACACLVSAQIQAGAAFWRACRRKAQFEGVLRSVPNAHELLHQ
jgi:hypothetical protein